MGLEIYAGQRIKAEDTLIIFDEIQEVLRALSLLKCFYEDAPEYHIICAGSLLGIALYEGTSLSEVCLRQSKPLQKTMTSMRFGISRNVFWLLTIMISPSMRLIM